MASYNLRGLWNAKEALEKDKEDTMDKQMEVEEMGRGSDGKEVRTSEHDAKNDKRASQVNQPSERGRSKEKKKGVNRDARKAQINHPSEENAETKGACLEEEKELIEGKELLSEQEINSLFNKQAIVSKIPGTDNEGKPINIDVSESEMVQASDRCASGCYCKKGNSQLRVNQRCMGCGFCVHMPCCFALVRTRKEPKNKVREIASNLRYICIHCVSIRGWQSKIYSKKGHKNFIIMTSNVEPIIKKWPEITLTEWSKEDEAKWEEQKIDQQPMENNIEKEDRVKTGTQSPEQQNLQSSETLESRRNDDKMDLSDNEKETTPMEEVEEETIEFNDASSDSTQPASSARKKRRKVRDEPALLIEKQSTGRNREMSRKIYLDLQIPIPIPTDTLKADESMNALVNALREWLETMQRMNKSFFISTLKPDADLLTDLRDPSQFPTSLNEIKAFFKMASPRPNGGKLYTKVLASFEGSPDELIKDISWYFTGNAGRVYVCAIQALDTVIVGSLLYSLRSMNVEALKTAISWELSKPIHLKWMRMADGEPMKKGSDWKKEPHALHIECASKDQATVEKYFRTRYSSTSMRFPLHIRMRFIPQLSKVMRLGSIQKHHMMRHRQHGWCTQSKAITSYDISGVDSPIPGHGAKTMRDAVMGILSTENHGIQLIFSMDLSWRGSGIIFSFHPKRAKEAAMVIKGLYPRMAHRFGEENIKPFFSVEAIIEGQSMKYDPITHQVTCAADESLEALMGIDKDMDLGEVKDDNDDDLFGAREVEFVKEKTIEDEGSVSTFGEKSKTARSDKRTTRCRNRSEPTEEGQGQR
jgi:hypothetical protein